MNPALPPTDTEDLQLRSLETIPHYLLSTVDKLIRHLNHSVSLLVSNIPRRGVEVPSVRSVPARVAVLFSGGIDSTVCAFLAHK